MNKSVEFLSDCADGTKSETFKVTESKSFAVISNDNADPALIKFQSDIGKVDSDEEIKFEFTLLAGQCEEITD